MGCLQRLSVKPGSCPGDSEEVPSSHHPVFLSWPRWRCIRTGKEMQGMHPVSLLSVVFESTAFWTVLKAQHRGGWVQTRAKWHIYLLVASFWQFLGRRNQILLSKRHYQLFSFVVQSLSCLTFAPRGLQHARLHAPSPPGVCSNSCPLQFSFLFAKCVGLIDGESDDCFYGSKTGNIFFLDIWWLIWGSANN